MSRLPVRVTEQFFESLDRQLPAERDGRGGPSRTDFLAFDLPGTIDALAEDYYGVTMATSDPQVRVMVTTGPLVPAFRLYVTFDAVTVLVHAVELDR